MFGRPTLSDLLARYLECITPTKKSAVSERARLGAMRRRPIARLAAHRVTPADVAAYRDARLREVAPATVRRELGVLAHAFDVARREWGYKVKNPVREVRWPTEPRGRERRLVARFDEAGRLLDACRRARNPFLLPVVEFALETAMRRGEILRLRWEDIDLGSRTATLHETKNGYMRVVPLSSGALRVLRSLPPRPSGHVFPVTGEAVKLAFKRATRRAGLVDFRFHDLRHEATTRLFERGLELMEVASITGHRDPRKLRGYTHLKAEALARKLG